MSPSGPFETIRQALRQVSESGQKTVDVAALISFVDAVERDAPVKDETRKLEHDSRLAQYKAERDVSLEMLRSVLDAARTALNSSILINGGAAAALLALLGNLYGKSGGSPAALPLLVQGLASFTSGVLLGGLATAGAYLTQWCYTERHPRTAIGFHLFSVLLVISSYGAFAYGIVSAYRAFST